MLNLRAKRLTALARIFFVFALCSLPGFAQNGLSPEQEALRQTLRRDAAQRQLWADPYWRKLLYYERNWFGQYHSVCINRAFFLSPDGKKEPSAELYAAIDGLFYSGDADDDSPECQFPERYLWLRKTLGVTDNDAHPPYCEKFNKWRAGLDPEAVSLLFAAGYLNNPSTLYGHTFLRLHKRGAAGADLLDYTVTYAATADETGLMFAFKGLIGAYPGQYSTIPYYLKIQEYHNLEDRDLWEFPLSLTQPEIDRLMRHAWELGKASFPYLFFTRNCAWQPLQLLDIAKPELDLESRFPVWVIPADTVKAVIDAAPPAQPVWRPSLWKHVVWKRAQLSPEERSLVLALSRGDQAAAVKKVSALPPNRAAAVLETTADYLGWRQYARRINQDELDRRSDPLLALRASLGNQTTFTGKPPLPFNVAKAHDSMRLGAGVTTIKGNGPAYELQWRFALQDILDPPDGYLPDAALEMGALRMRYAPENDHFYFKEAKLAHVLSLNPWDDWMRRKSWEVNVGFEQADETGRATGTSAVWDMSAASGLAFETHLVSRELFYTMLVADSGLGMALDRNWRVGGGAKAGVLAKNGPLLTQAEARYIGYAMGDRRSLWAGNITASLQLAKNTVARAEYGWRGSAREGGVYLQQFFFP